MRKITFATIFSSIMILAACGGGGTGGSDGDPPIIDEPAPQGPGSICGISPAGDASSADGVEGEWSGAFPIFSGVDIVYGIGLVTRDGAAQFWVGGQFLAGTLAATDTGRVSSALVSYTVGGDDAFVVRDTRSGIEHSALQFDQVSPHDTLSGMFKAALSDCEPVDLHYQATVEQTPSLASIAGVYSDTETPERAVVVSVDPDGRFRGSYANGCTLLGTLGMPDATRNYFSASIDVSSCGDGDGHYDGYTWLDSSGTLYFGVISDERALYGAVPRT